MKHVEAKILPLPGAIDKAPVSRVHTDRMLRAITDELVCIQASRARAFKGAPRNDEGDQIPKRRPAREHNREVVRRLAAIWGIVAECANSMSTGEFDNLMRRMQPVIVAEQQNMGNWLAAEAAAAPEAIKASLVGVDVEDEADQATDEEE